MKLNKNEIQKQIDQAEKKAQEAREALINLQKAELNEAYKKFGDYSSNSELIIALLKNESSQSRKKILDSLKEGGLGLPRKKVTAELRDSVKKALNQGNATQAKIAEDHGISLATLAKIKRGDYDHL